MTIYLSGHLKAFTGGKTEVRLTDRSTTVGDALNELWSHHPALRERVLNEQGEIREHVNVFVGSDNVKRRKGLETKIDTNEIHVFNAVSGG